MSMNEIPSKVNHLRDVDSVPPVDVDWLWFDRIGYVEIHFRFLEQSLIIKKEMAFRWDREELGLGEFVRNLYELGSAAAPNIGSSWMFVREGVDHERRGPLRLFLSLIDPERVGSA